MGGASWKGVELVGGVELAGGGAASVYDSLIDFSSQLCVSPCSSV